MESMKLKGGTNIPPQFRLKKTTPLHPIKKPHSKINLESKNKVNHEGVFWTPMFTDHPNLVSYPNDYCTPH